ADAEVVRGYPRGQDQVVVADLPAVREPDRPGSGVDPVDLAADVPGVPPGGEPANGVRDVARMHPAGRHLVKQGLKRAVEVLVDYCDPEPRLAQSADCGQAGGAGPGD